MTHRETRNITLLLAGGIGSRISDKCPKQFIEIDGESVLLHTMRAFQQHPDIEALYVVCTPKWKEYVNEQARKGGIGKFKGTFAAGPTSAQSIRNGIEGLLELYGEDAQTLVLVHDAVRPFVNYEIIGRNIQVCQEKGNAITAIYSNEAYMRITDGTTSDHCIPREELMRAQTPQTFPLKTLGEIMQKARELGVEHFQSLYTLCSDVGHKPLFVAEGDSINFKLTEPKDIKIYQALKDLIF